MKRRRFALLVFASVRTMAVVVTVLASNIAAAVDDGSALYAARCASCHDEPVSKIPSRAMLSQQEPSRIVVALTDGVMRAQAADLPAESIRALATYLTVKVADSGQGTSAHSCASSDGSEWNGWGRDLENTRFQPDPELTAEGVRRLRPRWVFAYPGFRAWGQPTVVGDDLFVSSSTGKVFALDAKTGRTIWEFDAEAPVRSAVSVGARPGADCGSRIAYFGDQKANVYAVNATTGKGLWRVRVEDFPGAVITGSPKLYEGRLYVPLSSNETASAGYSGSYECCKFRGSVVALDAESGGVLWRAYTIADAPAPTRTNSAGAQMFGPAGAAVWNSPTIDVERNVLYVGTGNSYSEVGAKTANAILAFDLDTGALKWSRQFTPNDNFVMGCVEPGVNNCPAVVGPDFDFGSSPILRKLPNGKRLVLAGQKSGALHAVDPDRSGEPVWQVQLSGGSYLGGIQWGPAADEQNVYVAISDVVAPDDGLPALHAIDIESGRTIWSAPAPKPDCAWGAQRCSHALSQAVAVIPGVVFSGSIDGHMRAYDTKTGSVLWDFDTARMYPAVNGGSAKGGSLDGGGAAVAGGMLYVNSGYPFVSGEAGNALIAFSPDDSVTADAAAGDEAVARTSRR